MIIINNQPIHAGSISHMVEQSKYSESIINAMADNHDVFNYPNAAVLGTSVRFRSHIVDSAYQLSESDVKFATFYGSRCNDQFWQLTREGGFQLKGAARPSEAITDIFKNSKVYAFECATAMVIILLKAALALLGTERFDAVFRHIYLWDWHHQEHLPLIIEPMQEQGIPGDIVYFKNPDVNPRTAWWQGENTIVLPNNHFYGHGVGVQSAQNVVKILNKYRRPGATESAYLLPRATRVDISQLYLFLGREMAAWTRNRQNRSVRRRPTVARSVIRPFI